MILTREGIQRMIDGVGNGAAGGGGGDISALLAGYATESWVDENYLSIEFFSKLFKAYNSANPAVEIKPNDTQSTITNIKAMFGFWTEQYLSALGQNAGGGGGGATTLADLLDVELSSPADNQVLTYYNGKWRNMNAAGVDMSTVWNALGDNTTTQQIAHSHLTTALSGYLTGITSSMIITALGYTPANNADLSNYLPKTGGTLTNSDGILTISSTSANSWIYFKSTKSSTSANRSAIGYYGGLSFLSNEASYARIGVTDDGTPQYWLNALGTIKYTLLHSGNIGNYNAGSATKLQTARTIWGHSFDGTSDIEGTLQLNRYTSDTYGRISFYRSDYYTWYFYMAMVGNDSPTTQNAPSGNFVTSWALRSLIENTNGFGWTWESCTNTSGATPSIKMELSSTTGNLYVAGNICNGGSVGIGTTAPLYKLHVGGDVYASGAAHSQSIELNESGGLSGYGGFIDFHYNGSSADYTSRIIEDTSGRLHIYASNGVQIGDAVLIWDSANNALKVTKYSSGAEVAVNLYATGGISALGYGVSGGGGAGDVTWDALRDNTDERPIALSHISTALQGYLPTVLSGYLPLSGGTINAANSHAPLILKGGTSGFREGLRIIPTGDWSDIVLGGNDITESSGTSANTWFLGNNNGKFYITRNGADSGTARLSCVENIWSFKGRVVVSNTGNSEGNYNNTALCIREYNYGGVQTDTWGNAPRMAWVWNGVNAAQIGLDSRGYLCEAPAAGTTFYRILYEYGTWGINISGSAAKLTTARSLWGNSFDGTADITSHIAISGNFSFGDYACQITNNSTGSYASAYSCIFPNCTTSDWVGGLVAGKSGTKNNAFTINFGYRGNASTDNFVGIGFWSNDNILTIKVDKTATFSSTVSATGFIKTGGTSSQFLKADGSVDGNTYALSSSLANYLPLTGGTMTGTLTLKTNGTGDYNQGIRINRVNTDSWALLLIGKSGDRTSGTGTTTAGDGAWLIGTPASSNSLIFNLNNASESFGLCLKGHGVSDMKWNNNTVWHAGNDGSGSGMDADYLDGQHGSYYATASSVTTLEGYFTNGSANTAIKLQTARTIWGQSFDGSGNVDEMIRVLIATSTTIASPVAKFLQYTASPFGLIISTRGSDGCVLIQSQREANNNETFNISLNANGGNVGIGTASPSYKLHVVGDVYASGAAHSQSIELNESGGLSGYGGFIDFHYNGTSSDYSIRLIESTANILSVQAMQVGTSNITCAGLEVGGGQNASYIQIGNGRIVWDSTNHALRVTSADGTATNLYATGGVSALGLNTIATDGTVSASLVPGTTATYDLGSSSYKWRDLYMSGRGTNFSIINYSSYTYLGTSNYFNFGADILIEYNGLHIGTRNTNYDLYVNGENGGNGYFVGNVSAASITNRSDMRLKNVMTDLKLSVNAVANAPLFLYTFKNGKGQVMAGTSAQYWNVVLPQTVFTDPEGMMSLDYGVTALAGVISVAREVSEHERRIAKLEAENATLRAEIEDLKAA